MASYLALEHKYSKNQDADFISLVVLALLGLLHPANKVDLPSDITDLACQIILETQFLAQTDVAMGLPHFEDFGSFKRRMAATLVEIIVEIPSENNAVVLWKTASAPESWDSKVFITKPSPVSGTTVDSF